MGSGNRRFFGFEVRGCKRTIIALNKLAGKNPESRRRTTPGKARLPRTQEPAVTVPNAVNLPLNPVGILLLLQKVFHNFMHQHIRVDFCLHQLLFTHTGKSKQIIDQAAHPACRVDDRPNGYFVGPTVFDAVSPGMAIGREEIFGPVASICPVRTLDEAIAVMQAHPNANATSIFTSSGRAAREFSKKASASMVGVNIGVAAPMAYFPFGGAKDSFFGDLKVHGRDAFEFYTDKKVTISRWY